MTRFATILILALLLTGCATQSPQPPQPTPGTNATAVLPTAVATLETPAGQATEPASTPASPGQPTVTQAPAAESAWVAYIGADMNLWLVDAASGEMTKITQDAANHQPGSAQNLVEYCCAQWSSDGKLLAYQRQEGKPQGDGLRFSFSLWVYDVERGESRVVLDNQEIAGFAWKPGTHLITYGLALPPDYFSGRGQINPQAVRGIWAVEVDGQNAPYELVKAENGRSTVRPEWSPDGRYLGFEEVALYEGRGMFAYYDLAAQQYIAWNRQTGNFDWSPDGQSLVYDQLTYIATGEERILRSGLDGSTEQPISPVLNPEYAFLPVFSPAGDQVAYLVGLSGTDSSPYTLMVQPSSEGEPRRMGVFDQAGNLDWSPDGQYLLLSSGPYDQRQVVSVNVSDGTIQVLAPGSQPAWRP